MLNLLIPFLILAQSPSAGDATESKREPLFYIRQGLQNFSAPLPVVDLNRSSRSGEDVEFLDEAGLPVIAAYYTPIVRYHEHSPYISDNPTKHLLVQLALTGDAKRFQVIVVEAIRRDRLWWEITRRRVGYGSPKSFETAVRSVTAAAGKLPYYNPGVILVCSHNPRARIDVRIPGEIDLARGGVCQNWSYEPAVVAGRIVIDAAEAVLGQRVEPVATFLDSNGE
jgi:hypothetical protein